MVFRCGSIVHDLVDVCTIDLTEPSGWITVPLSDPFEKEMIPPGPVRAHLIQMKILSMHQNGRDTRE